MRFVGVLVPIHFLLLWGCHPQVICPQGGILRVGDSVMGYDLRTLHLGQNGTMWRCILQELEEMPEIWQQEKIHNYQRPTGVNCKGICFIYLIYTYTLPETNNKISLKVNGYPGWKMKSPFWGKRPIFHIESMFPSRPRGVEDEELSGVGFSRSFPLGCGILCIPFAVFETYTNCRERYPNSSWCGYDGYIHSTSVAPKVPLEVYLVKKKRPERVILKFRPFGWSLDFGVSKNSEWQLVDVDLDEWCVSCGICWTSIYFCCKYQSSVSKKVVSVGEQWYLQAFWSSKSQIQLLFRNLPLIHGFCAAIGSESAGKKRGMPGQVVERGAAKLYAPLRMGGHRGQLRSRFETGPSRFDAGQRFALVEGVAWNSWLRVICNWRPARPSGHRGNLEHGRRGKRFAWTSGHAPKRHQRPLSHLSWEQASRGPCAMRALGVQEVPWICRASAMSDVPHHLDGCNPCSLCRMIGKNIFRQRPTETENMWYITEPEPIVIACFPSSGVADET